MIRSVATGKMLSNRPPVLPIESPRFAVETVSLMLKRKHQKMWSQTPRTVDIDQDCRGSECDSHCVSFTRKIGNWWNWFVKFDKKWHDNNSLKSNFKKWKLILICLVKIGWRPIIAFALMLASQSANSERVSVKWFRRNRSTKIACQTGPETQSFGGLKRCSDPTANLAIHNSDNDITTIACIAWVGDTYARQKAIAYLTVCESNLATLSYSTTYHKATW